MITKMERIPPQVLVVSGSDLALKVGNALNKSKALKTYLIFYPTRYLPIYIKYSFIRKLKLRYFSSIFK